MTRNVFIMLTASFVLWGCIGVSMSDDRTEVSASKDAIVAEAEFVSDTDNEKVVVIRSNRSWFAHLDDLDHPVDPADPDARVTWASLSVDHHQNLTNTEDETEIIITFNENESPYDINGVLNIWCEGKIVTSIPVRQEGRVFHVSARTEVEAANCDSDIVPVIVDCNTKWTARISDSSTAEASLDAGSGNGAGTLNVIFGENFSLTEEKTAVIIFSAKNCDDFILTIAQNKAVPYLSVLPEYDGRVLGGENGATLQIRSNADWTAELVESELEDFAIVNPSGKKGTSEPQDVNVTFKANDSGDPYDIRTARIRFTVDGIEPVEYRFSQRGTFVLSFEEPKAFSPEIANTLNSGNTHPEPDKYNNNLCRPDRVNTDVDEFVYTSGDNTMTVELSQYIRMDSPTASLYVIGSGKLPHLKFSGFEGLTLCKLSAGFTGAGWFAGNVVSEDHVLAGKNTLEYTEYNTQISWSGSGDGSLYYIDFDLSEKGNGLQPGQGCTLRTSSANSTSSSNCTKMYVKTITFKYL